MTPDRIIEIVSHTLDVSPEHIKSKWRKREVVEARHISVWLMRCFCEYEFKKQSKSSWKQISYRVIATSLNRSKSHSTFVQSMWETRDLLITDQSFGEKLIVCFEAVLDGDD
jgi:chromosomal replication initiation ATPase DnaA